MTARVAPGGWRELGVVNWLAVRVLSRAAGTRDAALFSALGRHRRLFRGWLGFAAQLMPFGRLPAAERELVILRVAALRGCAYEWRHHERLGLRAGLSAARWRRSPWSSRWRRGVGGGGCCWRPSMPWRAGA